MQIFNGGGGVFEQPTQRTFDYVLVAHKVDDDMDQKAQRQRAFIQQLEKKNITVTVSLLPLLSHISSKHHD